MIVSFGVWEALDKTQHPFMTTILGKREVEKNFLNWIKGAYKTYS